MSERRRTQLIGVALIVGLVVCSYAAFHPSLPFSHGYRLHAVVASSNQLKSGAPVRIAGVTVGKVTGVGPGPANTSTLTLELQPSALPLHRDATLRIRPRVFLEGGFYVELHPGSPSAPRLHADGTLPLPQTSIPVQFHQLLTTFDRPTRASLRAGLGVLSDGLAHGGGDGLRAVAPQLRPTLRDIAWVAQAARGTAPHDVSSLIASAARVSGALGRDPTTLARLVGRLRVTAAALDARGRELGASITQVDDLMRSAPPALHTLDAALPVVARVAGEARPALPGAPAALRRATGVLNGIGSLVAPATRRRTIAGLTTTFRDLPTVVDRLGSLFPSTKPLADCLRTHIVPLLDARAPDGTLSSGRPVWQDFAHAMVGLSSATQNFDGNGYATRYLAGFGANLVSTGTLPIIGKLLGDAATPLRSRPLPPAAGPPAFRPHANCAAQPVPSLATPSGASGLRAAGPARRTTITHARLRHALKRSTVRASLRGTR